MFVVLVTAWASWIGNYHQSFVGWYSTNRDTQLPVILN